MNATPEKTQKPKDKPASKYTAFRCPVDVLQRAKAAARGERRSLSNFIVTVLERSC